MEIHITNQSLLIFLVAAGAIFVVFSMAKRLLRVILTLIVAFAFLYYVVALSNVIRPRDKHTKYSIDYIRQNMADNLKTAKDSLTYFYIVEPIYQDLAKQYTEQERLKLERYPLKYMQVVDDAIKRNKKDILRNLSKRKEQQLLADFKKQFKKDLGMFGK